MFPGAPTLLISPNSHEYPKTSQYCYLDGTTGLLGVAVGLQEMGPTGKTQLPTFYSQQKSNDPSESHHKPAGFPFISSTLLFL